MSAADPKTVPAVERFLGEVLERIAGRVPVVKPQIALFEQLGPEGLAALARLCRRARELGLIVLMDAKRGDIGSTAEGYAAAYLGADAPFPSDALTVNPYMGLDTVSPYLRLAERHGRGVFVLVKTSNPGSGAFQDFGGDQGPLFQHVASALSSNVAALAGPVTGWSALGVVMGATYPDQAQHVRALLPRALFLIPGYGAQGGTAADAVATFVRVGSQLEGGLVNSSRGILFPTATGAGRGGGGGTEGATWERLFEQALSRAVDALAAAIA